MGVAAQQSYDIGSLMVMIESALEIEGRDRYITGRFKQAITLDIDGEKYAIAVTRRRK